MKSGAPVGWRREAEIGAAREFGARHYRLFGALKVARVVGPGALGACATLALGWLAWTAARALVAQGWPLAVLVTAGALGALVFVWRRFGWMARAYVPALGIIGSVVVLSFLGSMVVTAVTS